jgi:hypothetical protein
MAETGLVDVAVVPHPCQATKHRAPSFATTSVRRGTALDDDGQAIESESCWPETGAAALMRFFRRTARGLDFFCKSSMPRTDATDYEILMHRWGAAGRWGVGQARLDEQPYELLSMLNLKQSAPRASPEGRTHQSAPPVSWSGIGVALWR